MKILKYVLVIAVIGLLAYKSVYFRKLDEVKKSAATQFDAVAYARDFLKTKLPPVLTGAVDLKELLAMIASSKDSAFNKYSHAMAVGNIRYFMVKGSGVVTAIDDDNVTVALAGDSSNKSLTITTGFIYGNAIRDASALIDNTAFSNTADFNNISASVNKIIRDEVIPPFKTSVKKGSMVDFAGAIELNREHVNIDQLVLVPVTLQLK